MPIETTKLSGLPRAELIKRALDYAGSAADLQITITRQAGAIASLREECAQQQALHLSAEGRISDLQAELNLQRSLRREPPAALELRDAMAAAAMPHFLAWSDGGVRYSPLEAMREAYLVADIALAVRKESRP